MLEGISIYVTKLRRVMKQIRMFVHGRFWFHLTLLFPICWVSKCCCTIVIEVCLVVSVCTSGLSVNYWRILVGLSEVVVWREQRSDLIVIFLYVHWAGEFAACLVSWSTFLLPVIPTAGDPLYQDSSRELIGSCIDGSYWRLIPWWNCSSRWRELIQESEKIISFVPLMEDA